MFYFLSFETIGGEYGIVHGSTKVVDLAHHAQVLLESGLVDQVSIGWIKHKNVVAWEKNLSSFIDYGREILRVANEVVDGTFE